MKRTIETWAPFALACLVLIAFYLRSKLGLALKIDPSFEPAALLLAREPHERTAAP